MAENPPETPVSPASPAGPSRRSLLGALGGGIVVGSALGIGGTTVLTHDRGAERGGSGSRDGDRTVPVSGEHQSGVHVPATPQPHGVVMVCDITLLDDDSADPVAGLTALLAATQRVIETVRRDPGVSPEGAGDLTITVGLGARAVSAISAQLPGAEPLPEFASDDTVRDADRGGDLLLAVNAGDPGVVARAVLRLGQDIAGVRLRWQQRGFRGAGTGTIARNPLGHLDGVIVPRGDRELAENVWIGEGPAKGGTICVIRRLRLDVPAFAALSGTEQDRTIGRRRSDGTPLSGGSPHGQVDLTAKTADGQYRLPLRSHARAAHPSFTGSALMLRRGYMFDNGPRDGGEDVGLVFICFQRDLDTFVKTQRRLDEQDDLMDYVTPTASASFLILPGFTADRPLGRSVLAAASV